MKRAQAILINDSLSDTEVEALMQLLQQSLAGKMQLVTVLLEYRILLSDNESINFIDCNDIIAIKASSAQVEIYTTRPDLYGEKLMICKTLKGMQQMLLPAECFMRPHFSWLVNTIYMKRFCKKSIKLLLPNNLKVPVSRSNLPKVLSVLELLNSSKHLIIDTNHTQKPSKH